MGIARISRVEPDGFGGPMAAGDLIEDMFLRRSGATGNTGLSAFSWNTMVMLRNNGPTRTDYSNEAVIVKYTSPYFLGQSKSTGFQLQASWGMDDVWSAAVRFVDTFGAFRFAAGVGVSDVRAIVLYTGATIRF